MGDDNEKQGIDEETLAQLRDSNGGDIIHRETKWGDDVVFRMPTSAEWRRAYDEIQEEQTRYQAQKVLVSACRIYPEKAAFEKLLEKRPGLIISFFTEIGDEVGLGKAAIRKKS